MGRKTDGFNGLTLPFPFPLSGYSSVGQIGLDMVFIGRHQGYLHLGVGSHVLKQVASGDRETGICYTAFAEKCPYLA